MHRTITGNGCTRQSSLTQACTPVHADTVGYFRALPPIMNGSCTPSGQVDEIIAWSDGVMTRVTMVNTMLRHHHVDCSHLDALAEAGRVQLAAAQALAGSGNQAGTRTAILQFRSTVTSLRDRYRDILVREDLPGDMAQGVLSVAQSLAVTAVKAGLT